MLCVQHMMMYYFYQKFKLLHKQQPIFLMKKCSHSKKSNKILWNRQTVLPTLATILQPKSVHFLKGPHSRIVLPSGACQWCNTCHQHRKKITAMLPRLLQGAWGLKEFCRSRRAKSRKKNQTSRLLAKHEPSPPCT